VRPRPLPGRTTRPQHHPRSRHRPAQARPQDDPARVDARRNTHPAPLRPRPQTHQVRHPTRCPPPPQTPREAVRGVPRRHTSRPSLRHGRRMTTTAFMTLFADQPERAEGLDEHLACALLTAVPMRIWEITHWTPEQRTNDAAWAARSEEHTSELQSRENIV